MTDSEAHTHDTISLRGAGIVSVSQQKKGARFALDSLLLADFCRINSWDRILEPGAGNGIVSLLLAKKYPRSHIVAVELQSAAAKLCRKNIIENNLEDRIVLLEQDVRSLGKTMKHSMFDVIVANPPYTRTGAGRQSPEPARLSARHDRFGDIGAWLDLQVLLKNKGRYVMVFASERMTDLFASLRARKLEPKRMRLVHPYEDRPAALILMEAVKSAGTGLQVMPPLVVHAAGGGYTEEMRQIYGMS